MIATRVGVHGRRQTNAPRATSVQQLIVLGLYTNTRRIIAYRQRRAFDVRRRHIHCRRLLPGKQALTVVGAGPSRLLLLRLLRISRNLFGSCALQVHLAALRGRRPCTRTPRRCAVVRYAYLPSSARRRGNSCAYTVRERFSAHVLFVFRALFCRADSLATSVRCRRISSLNRRRRRRHLGTVFIPLHRRPVTSLPVFDRSAGL